LCNLIFGQSESAPSVPTDAGNGGGAGRTFARPALPPAQPLRPPGRRLAQLGEPARFFRGSARLLHSPDVVVLHAG